MYIKILSGILGLTFLSASLVFANPSWTGDIDNDWDVSGNWSTNQVPTATDSIRLANDSVDEPQIINISGTKSINNELRIDAEDDRSYTLNGGTLDFLREDGDMGAINVGISGTAPLIINSAITISTDPLITGGNTILNVSGTATREVFLNNSVTLGTGTRPIRIHMNAANTTLHLGGNNNLNVFQLSAGEAIFKSPNASPVNIANQLQGGNSATLSLGADAFINAGTGTATFLAAGNINVRAWAESPSSEDRTLDFQSRLAARNSSSKLTVVAPHNTTGLLIVEVSTGSATMQTLPVALHAQSVLRFTSSGLNPQWGPSTNGTAEISGAGDVELVGGGRLRLYSENTYTGRTLIDNGSRLSLMDDGSIAASHEIHIGTGSIFDIADLTGNFTLQANQTLSGMGTITAGGKQFTINGTLSPGNSAGTLTFDMDGGTLALGSDVSLVFDLGSISDLVVVADGPLDIGSGTLEFDHFTFTELAGFGVGDYTLFQTGESIVGTLGSSLSGNIGAYTGTLTIQGNDLVLTVIPEPAAAGLILAAVIPSLLLLRTRLGTSRSR